MVVTTDRRRKASADLTGRKSKAQRRREEEAYADAMGLKQGDKIFDKSRWFLQTGYTPHDAQELVHYDDHRHKVCCNGRRWGKTLLGAKETEATAFVLNRLGQPQRGWIVGPQFSDAEKEFRVVHDTLKKLGVDTVSTKFVNNPENGNMRIHTRWGWDLECRSALHPETLTGEGLDFVLMVEAGKHKRKTWTEYVRPTLSDKRGWSLHTGVPEGASDQSLLYHLYQRGQVQLLPSGNRNPWRSWRMPSWTNTVAFPGGRTDPEILDAEADLTTDEFDRQYGAKFVERVGRVLQEWDDDIHIRDLKFEPAWPLYMAIDFGYTNPWVLLWIQVDPFNNVYVIRERRWTMTDSDVIADDILTTGAEQHMVKVTSACYPDPAEPDDIDILRRRLKVPMRTNTGGLIKDRIKLIRGHMKEQNTHLPEGHPDRQPRMFVDRNCTQLIWEIRQGWRWPEHQSEVRNDSENPLDKDNHGPEALSRFFKGYFSVVGDANGRGGTRVTKAQIGSATNARFTGASAARFGGR